MGKCADEGGRDAARKMPAEERDGPHAHGWLACRCERYDHQQTEIDHDHGQSLAEQLTRLEAFHASF